MRLYIFLASRMFSGDDIKQPGISAVGDQQRLRHLVADLKNTCALASSEGAGGCHRYDNSFCPNERAFSLGNLIHIYIKGNALATQRVQKLRLSALSNSIVARRPRPFLQLSHGAVPG